MKFIAEIGWNFIGDLALAEEMIKAASESGADYAKFQIWNPEHLKKGPWDNDGRRQIYEKAFLNQDKILHLKSLVIIMGLNFLPQFSNTNPLSCLTVLLLMPLRSLAMNVIISH